MLAVLDTSQLSAKTRALIGDHFLWMKRSKPQKYIYYNSIFKVQNQAKLNYTKKKKKMINKFRVVVSFGE